MKVELSSDENLQALLSQSNPPLRQRRQRTNFSDDAIQILDEAFAVNPYPDINERESMAIRLKASEDRIQVWFQNRRARYRKRMQKENTASKKSTPKLAKTVAKSSKQVINEQTSPLRQHNNTTPNLNSTPISIYSGRPYKFNQSNNNQTINNSNDSGYYGQTSFNSMYSQNGCSLNSSPLSFNYTSSPYNSYYNFYPYFHSTQILGGSEEPATIPSPEQKQPRVPKSVFRPF